MQISDAEAADGRRRLLAVPTSAVVAKSPSGAECWMPWLDVLCPACATVSVVDPGEKKLVTIKDFVAAPAPDKAVQLPPSSANTLRKTAAGAKPT